MQPNQTQTLPDKAIMQIVEAIADAEVATQNGRASYPIGTGLQYVVHNSEAVAGEKAGALRAIGSLDEVLPRYDGQPLKQHRLLVPFIGGQGDSLMMAASLLAIQSEYPESRCDIFCPKTHHPLLSMIDGLSKPRPYPLPASQLKHYSFYASLEGINRFRHRTDLNNFQVFSQCLQMPEPREVVRFDLPVMLQEQGRLKRTDSPRVGIAFTRSSNMRSYPTELAIALAEALITQGVAVYFFGLSQEIGSELPDAPPMLCNWIDKTPNVNALIAMIRQMDAMVCPDSFPMHLAGSLRIPTLAIFTSSPTRIVGGYTTINPITATAGCNPCGAIADQCPLHHPECIVPRQTDLHPETLAQQVMNLLQSSCKPHGGHCSPHPI